MEMDLYCTVLYCTVLFLPCPVLSYAFIITFYFICPDFILFTLAYIILLHRTVSRWYQDRYLSHRFTLTLMLTLMLILTLTLSLTLALTLILTLICYQAFHDFISLLPTLSRLDVL